MTKVSREILIQYLALPLVLIFDKSFLKEENAC